MPLIIDEVQTDIASAVATTNQQPARKANQKPPPVTMFLRKRNARKLQMREKRLRAD